MIPRNYIYLLIGLMLLIAPVYAENEVPRISLPSLNNIPTINDALNVFKASSYDYAKNYGPTQQMQIIISWINNPINITNTMNLLIFIIVPFLFVFLLVYSFLTEIRIIENDRTNVVLALLMVIMAYVTGAIGFISFIVSSLGAIGVLIVFGALILLGLSRWYERRATLILGTSIVGSWQRHLIMYSPLLIASVIVTIILFALFMGSVPYTGVSGLIVGAIVGALVLGLIR